MTLFIQDAKSVSLKDVAVAAGDTFTDAITLHGKHDRLSVELENEGGGAALDKFHLQAQAAPGAAFYTLVSSYAATSDFMLNASTDPNALAAGSKSNIIYGSLRGVYAIRWLASGSGGAATINVLGLAA